MLAWRAGKPFSPSATSLLARLGQAVCAHTVLCKEPSAASCVRACGAEVDLERVVLELTGRQQARTQSSAEQRKPDAIMDLYAQFRGVPGRFFIDVTVRSPHAAWYPDAATMAGQAADGGAKDKMDLYSPEVLAQTG